MKTVFVVALTALVSACAAPAPQPYRYWGKEGVSKQAAADQLGFCRHEVRASDLSAEQATKLVGYCMRAKGYVLMTGYR